MFFFVRLSLGGRGLTAAPVDATIVAVFLPEQPQDGAVLVALLLKLRCFGSAFRHHVSLAYACGENDSFGVGDSFPPLDLRSHVESQCSSPSKTRAGQPRPSR